MENTPDITRFRTREGGFVGPEELHDLLLDEGYSAGNREQYLKSLLTELSQAEAEHEHAKQELESPCHSVRRFGEPSLHAK